MDHGDWWLVRSYQIIRVKCALCFKDDIIEITQLPREILTCQEKVFLADLFMGNVMVRVRIRVV